MRRLRPATRDATNVPTLNRIGTVARLPATPSAACTGWRWTCSRRRTRVARCSSAESITSSRRRCRLSISVTGSPQSIAQRLLVALQDGDRVLEQRTAVLRYIHQVGDARAAREQEDRGEPAEDGRAVRLRGPQHEREDAEQQAEGDEVEAGDGDHEESHRPGLFLGELDR